MAMHVETNRAISSWVMFQGRMFNFHHTPILKNRARSATPNRYRKSLSKWLLGAGILTVLAGAGTYFLHVSPHVIRVLGPLVAAG